MGRFIDIACPTLPGRRPGNMIGRYERALLVGQAPPQWVARDLGESLEINVRALSSRSHSMARLMDHVPNLPLFVDEFPRRVCGRGWLADLDSQELYLAWTRLTGTEQACRANVIARLGYRPSLFGATRYSQYMLSEPVVTRLPDGSFTLLVNQIDSSAPTYGSEAGRASRDALFAITEPMLQALGGDAPTKLSRDELENLVRGYKMSSLYA
jgi:hypothetical protein